MFVEESGKLTQTVPPPWLVWAAPHTKDGAYSFKEKFGRKKAGNKEGCATERSPKTDPLTLYSKSANLRSIESAVSCSYNSGISYC